MAQKIGIMGDSHDNLGLMRRAVDRFNRDKVSHVLHTGDIVSPFAAKELGRLSCPFTVTFGNNDGERLMLRDVVMSLGGRLLWPLATLSIEGKRIALLHGEDRDLVSALARSGDFSLVACGHWHDPTVQKTRNGDLVVNPGETCGYLTGRATVAIADLETKDASIIDL
jgi:putative phosphoesterase